MKVFDSVFWIYFTVFSVIMIIGLISMYDNNRSYIGILWLLILCCIFIIMFNININHDGSFMINILLIFIIFSLFLFSIESKKLTSKFIIMALLVMSCILYLYIIIKNFNLFLISSIYMFLVILLTYFLIFHFDQKDF